MAWVFHFLCNGWSKAFVSEMVGIDVASPWCVVYAIGYENTKLFQTELFCNWLRYTRRTADRNMLLNIQARRLRHWR